MPSLIRSALSGVLPPLKRPKRRAIRQRRAASAPRPNANRVVRGAQVEAAERTSSTHATSALKKPQTMLTVDDDRPSPGGVANGLWNARPMEPATTWGMAFNRKAPPKNQAT